jgi:hypothetical protein
MEKHSDIKKFVDTRIDQKLSFIFSTVTSSVINQLDKNQMIQVLSIKDKIFERVDDTIFSSRLNLKTSMSANIQQAILKSVMNLVGPA